MWDTSLSKLLPFKKYLEGFTRGNSHMISMHVRNSCKNWVTKTLASREKWIK